MRQDNRRTFLKKSLGVGGVLAVAGSGLPLSVSHAAATGQRLPGSAMRFGLVTYLWAKDWDLPTLIKNCEQTKVLGVELRVQHAHAVESTLSAQQRRMVKQRFADSPVELLGMGCNYDFHHADPAKVKENIEGAKIYAKLSHDCGGTGIKVKPNALPKDESVDKTCAQIGKALNEVGRYAADYQQEIRVEVHGRDTSELPIMKKIFDSVTAPNVGVCWNCNSQDLNGQGLTHNFNLVKGRFGTTCHIRELNIGDYPYQQLMDLFVKMDYPGWILLEARTKPKKPIQALLEQRQVFEQMVLKAQLGLG